MGTYGGLKIKISTVRLLTQAVRSAVRADNNTVFVFCSPVSSKAVRIVVLAADVAWLFTSIAMPSMGRWKRWCSACCKAKAVTMPEPVPISTRSGVGDAGGKRVVRNAISWGRESVSSRR